MKLQVIEFCGFITSELTVRIIGCIFCEQNLLKAGHRSTDCAICIHVSCDIFLKFGMTYAIFNEFGNDPHIDCDASELFVTCSPHAQLFHMLRSETILSWRWFWFGIIQGFLKLRVTRWMGKKYKIWFGLFRILVPQDSQVMLQVGLLSISLASTLLYLHL